MAKIHVEDAVRTAGTQAKLARALGVSQQAVSMWLRRGWVSPTRAREIEALYGIERQKLIDPKLSDLMDTNFANDFVGG